MSSTCVLSPTTNTLSSKSSPADQFKMATNESSCASAVAAAAGSSSVQVQSTSRLPAIHPALRSMQPSHSQCMIQDNCVDSYYQSSNEVIHEAVTLLSGNNGPKRVILSVFRTTVDHFALVYPDNRRKAVAIKPAGCINLRGVTCEETVLGAGLKGFTLRPKKCDTSSAALIFVCSDVNMLPKWLDALSPLSSAPIISSSKTSSSSGGSPSNKRFSSCRQSSLPSLEEEEE